MNDFYLGETAEKKPPLMVDFNYNTQRKKGSRKKILQIVSSKLNPKQALNSNPKDIFNANNKINSILSKNLKSIYEEVRVEKNMDQPLYKNVNSIIKKNNNNNRFMYNQIMNFNSNSSRTNLRNEYFQNSGDILNNLNRYDSLFKTSIITSPNLKNQINYSQPVSINS